MEDFGHQSMHNEQNAMNIYKVNEWAEFRKEFQRLLPNIPIIDLRNDNRCKNNRFLRQKRKKNEKIIKNTCENDAACV